MTYMVTPMSIIHRVHGDGMSACGAKVKPTWDEIPRSGWATPERYGRCCQTCGRPLAATPPSRETTA